MTKYRREFTVGPTVAREVVFVLEGHEFACLPDITMAAMEEYRAGFVPDPVDPTKIGIPLEVCLRFIEATIAEESDIEEFRKLRAGLPLDTGAETMHAIREYLVECYSEAGPTTEPMDSSPGPPVSGPTLTADSGSPARIPTASPSAAT